MKIRKKVNDIFENKETHDLIYVRFEDLNGFLHYEYANDGTQQNYTMTWAELINQGYERID
jgi:hypothetical protein